MQDLTFSSEANFEMSAGFGPNQVSTLLGVSLIIVSLTRMFNLKIFPRPFYDYIFLSTSIGVALLTFARGGVIAPIIAVGFSYYVTKGLKHKSNVYILKFEDFVLAPEQNCKRLCDFLKIDYQSIMLEIENIGSSNTNDSQEKLIDISKIYKWKKNGLTNSEIYLAQLISSSLMNDFNYEKKRFVFPPFLVLVYLLIFPVKLFFALIFNTSFHITRSGKSAAKPSGFETILRSAP